MNTHQKLVKDLQSAMTIISEYLYDEGLAAQELYTASSG